MVDVIPGATYYDSVVDKEVVCESVARREESLDVVKMRYPGSDGTIEVPFHLMMATETLEVVKLPY